MRKRIVITGLLLPLALLLWNCTNIIELELPAHEPRLVVNGIFNPDSTWRIDVSASRGALSSESYEQVQHAIVDVYHGDKHLYNLPHAGNGLYKANDISPKELEHYTLKVSAPSYPVAQATGFVPAKPVTHSAKVRLVRTPDRNEGEITFILDDVATSQNYYFISAYYNDTSHLGTAFKHYKGIGFEAPIEQEFSLGWLYFFSDKLIDGKSVTLKIRYDHPGKDRLLYFNIAQVSPDYYHYAKTLTKQAVNDSFGQVPTAVHTNIQNGFGIFAGHNIHTYRIRH